MQCLITLLELLLNKCKISYATIERLLSSLDTTLTTENT